MDFIVVMTLSMRENIMTTQKFDVLSLEFPVDRVLVINDTRDIFVPLMKDEGVKASIVDSIYLNATHETVRDEANAFGAIERWGDAGRMIGLIGPTCEVEGWIERACRAFHRDYRLCTCTYEAWKAHAIDISRASKDTLVQWAR